MGKEKEVEREQEEIIEGRKKGVNREKREERIEGRKKRGKKK